MYPTRVGIYIRLTRWGIVVEAAMKKAKEGWWN